MNIAKMSEVESYFCATSWILKHSFSFLMKTKLFVRTHLLRKLLKIRKVFLDNETFKLYVFLMSLRQCILHVDYWKKATCIFLSDI